MCDICCIRNVYGRWWCSLHPTKSQVRLIGLQLNTVTKPIEDFCQSTTTKKSLAVRFVISFCFRSFASSVFYETNDKGKTWQIVNIFFLFPSLKTKRHFFWFKLETPRAHIRSLQNMKKKYPRFVSLPLFFSFIYHRHTENRFSLSIFLVWIAVRIFYVLFVIDGGMRQRTRRWRRCVSGRVCRGVRRRASALSLPLSHTHTRTATQTPESSHATINACENTYPHICLNLSQFNLFLNRDLWFIYRRQMNATATTTKIACNIFGP